MVERIERQGRISPGTSIAPLRRTAQDGREEEARRFQRELQRGTEDGGEETAPRHAPGMPAAEREKKGLETAGTMGAEDSTGEGASGEDGRRLGRSVDVVM